MNQRLAIVKEFLERENKRYCKILKIKPVPKLLYSLDELYGTNVDLKRFRPHQKFALSIFDDKERHIFINIKKHAAASDLIDTLVHELLHISDKRLRHGKKFQDTVDSIILGNVKL